MERRPLKIGITIGLREAGESLWLNGIKQNALYLAKLFMNSNYGHCVSLLNTTAIPITNELPWDRVRFPTVAFDDGWVGLDVLIELGGQIDGERTTRLKQQGTRIVSYCCGPEYIQSIEAMIFRRKLYESVYINQVYDAVWAIPQVFELNRGFFETLRRCDVREVPFVWDPMAIETACQDLPNMGRFRPKFGGKRIAILEPNVDVMKFCLYPIFIVEQTYRHRPDLIQAMYVANAGHLVHDEHEFVALMHYLDIVRDQKVHFIGRVVTPYFLAEHTDVVVSHQWGLPLNYLYLECCWQGFPFVHNAEKIKDLGYYYTDNDLRVGSNVLAAALESHDDRWYEYAVHQRRGIARFLADDPHLIAAYDDLLFGLFVGSAQ